MNLSENSPIYAAVKKKISQYKTNIITVTGYCMGKTKLIAAGLFADGCVEASQQMKEETDKRKNKLSFFFFFPCQNWEKKKVETQKVLR